MGSGVSPGAWPRLVSVWRLKQVYKEAGETKDWSDILHVGEGPRAESELPGMFYPVQAWPRPMQGSLGDCSVRVAEPPNLFWVIQTPQSPGAKKMAQPLAAQE